MAIHEVTVEDNLIFTDEVNINKSFLIVVEDILFLQDEVTNNKSITLIIEDKLNLSDEVQKNMTYQIYKEDGFKLSDEVISQVKKDNKIIYKTDAWVLNVDNFSFSRYENFYFNSFCQLNKDLMIGANDNGIYVIDEKYKTDDGTNIQSKIVTKEYQIFDTLSYVRDAMIYHKGDGEIFLNVKTDNGFDENYRLIGNGKEEILRLKMNKGTRSLKWQFSLVSDFGKIDLDKIVIYPLVTTRFRGV